MMQKEEMELKEQRGRVAPNMGAGGSHPQATSDPREEEAEERRKRTRRPRGQKERKDKRQKEKKRKSKRKRKS